MSSLSWGGPIANCGSHTPSAVQTLVQVQWRLALLLFGALAWSGAGCGGGKTPTPLKKPGGNAITQAVANVQSAVQNVATQTAGKIEIDFTPPIKHDQGFARLIPAGPQRPAVLQIYSYQDRKKDKPPYVFFQADLPNGDLAQLAGKSVPGRLFVQVDDENSVWQSSWSTPVQFRLSSVNSWAVTCDVTELEMVNAFNGTQAQMTGTLVGVLQTEGDASP